MKQRYKQLEQLQQIQQFIKKRQNLFKKFYLVTKKKSIHLVNDYKSKIEVPTCKDNLTKGSHFVIDPRLIEKSRNRKIKSEDWKKADLYSLGIVLFTLWIGNIFSRYKDDDIRFYTSQKKTNLIKDYLEEDKSINANLFKLISNLIEGDKSINEIYTECKDEKLYKFEL